MTRTVVFGPGLVVPYPEPTSRAASKIGAANKRTDTRAEVQLRSALHRRGLRFRKDLLVRVPPVRVHVDIAFTRAKLAVFVDGCFWHGCPEHRRLPKRNLDYWLPKFEANERRDRRVDAALSDDGWGVLRIWEHVDADAAAAVVVEELERSRTAR